MKPIMSRIYGALTGTGVCFAIGAAMAHAQAFCDDFFGQNTEKERRTGTSHKQRRSRPRVFVPATGRTEAGRISHAADAPLVLGPT